MLNNFIPVEAKVKSKKCMWYLDVSNLGLNDLISLKSELKGYAKSVVSLDAIIHETIDINCQDLRTERRNYKRLNGTYRNYYTSFRAKHRSRRK